MLELAPLIRSSTHFAGTLDSMPECHFHFFNEQKQALDDLKNMKRGKKTQNHLFLAKLRNRSLKCFKLFSNISTALLESIGHQLLGPGGWNNASVETVRGDRMR
jgi:hypothetical protein